MPGRGKRRTNAQSRVAIRIYTDHATFRMKKNECRHSQLLCTVLGLDKDDRDLLLKKPGPIVKLVLDWLKDASKVFRDPDELSDRAAAELLREIVALDMYGLYQVLHIADFFAVPVLVHHCCKEIASRLHGKSIEEISSICTRLMCADDNSVEKYHDVEMCQDQPSNAVETCA